MEQDTEYIQKKKVSQRRVRVYGGIGKGLRTTPMPKLGVHIPLDQAMNGTSKQPKYVTFEQVQELMMLSR